MNRKRNTHEKTAYYPDTLPEVWLPADY
jgi:hypothetical protein